MPNYSRNETVLVRYPFTDLSGSKVRPAVVVSTPHVSQDLFIVPLTSHTIPLLPGEFVLSDRAVAGLHVPTAVKRGIFTVQQTLIVKALGRVSSADAQKLDVAIRKWLGL